VIVQEKERKDGGEIKQKKKKGVRGIAGQLTCACHDGKKKSA
jgi:hypothetical protein